jgi:heptosyltransferase-2
VKRKRALIVKMGAIGDVIMTLPAAYRLHEEGWEVHWICGKVVAPLLDCYPWVRRIVVDEKAIMVGAPLRRMSAIARLWRKLAFVRYDLCATLNFDWRYRILTLPVRAGRRVALTRNSREANLIPGRSYADEFARLLMGAEDTCREVSLQPLIPDRLPSSPLAPGTAPRRVAIVPGGAGNFHLQLTLRRWPIESYVSLARALKQRGWEIVLTGGSEDDWVRSHFEGIDVTDCIGKLSIPEVLSLFNSCDAVVSHDTGPMHLAGVSQACLVAIFGPTQPGRFLPRRNSVVGIWGGEGFACRPCHDGQTFAPCRFAGCMHQVGLDMVIGELDRLLDARSARKPLPCRIVVPGTELVGGSEDCSQ